MKSALIFSLTVITLLNTPVQCYGEESPKTFQNFQTSSSKRSENYAGHENDSGSQYSPVYIGPQEGLKAADKIVALPGQPEEFKFDQYSGYVTVDPKTGRSLFYYFVESENCSDKPLVLWLSGVCSSLGEGAMKELGPFRVNKDGKTLRYNEYSWIKEANIIFLESPVGVGFSYTNTSSDYINGDKRVAKDSYTFLVNWLARFPEYKNSFFFMTGEGYSGHLIPQLAQLILHNNKIINQTLINLRGIAIGNAIMDDDTQLKARDEYLWTHGLISDEIHECLDAKCTPSTGFYSEFCLPCRKQAWKAVGNIDYTNIYASLCSPTLNTPWVNGNDPCVDNYISSYLNNADVQKSLHANSTGILGPWEMCSPYWWKNWTDAPNTVLPIIKELMATDINIWLYSGDLDASVPVASAKYAIKKLGTPVKIAWRPWYTKSEVGGYVVKYENLTFVTVRGAGYSVPSTQPASALVLFTSFLAEIPLPYKSD